MKSIGCMEVASFPGHRPAFVVCNQKHSEGLGTRSAWRSTALGKHDYMNCKTAMSDHFLYLHHHCVLSLIQAPVELDTNIMSSAMAMD